ncbi:ABC transporter substrate-binding protein [Dinoroseobacter sp. S124A]|uniref:ABC transporter substrate-binding protein n=1 Tax=Dinoroseobacter sp. S124A TaxID=3415128 RepID=UPI003C79FD9F
MRHTLLSLVGFLIAAPLAAFEIEDQARFGPEGATTTLEIISTADIAFFEPMILSYLAGAPDTAVAYTVASSAELDRALRSERARFDIAISSAMDLQTKLANDGLAQPHSSDATEALPDWALWNDRVFAFSQEPAAMVVSKAAFADLPLPRSRQELITTLRENPDRFRGRIGTYDVRQSGLGYLFATQDARTSETYWRLTEVMGALDVQLYCCSSDMIDGVVGGELAIAYNVLASYALGRTDRDAYTIILPSDFTTLMLRSALIPAGAAEPETARQFVDHLLSETFDGTALPPLSPASNDSAVRRIELGPALMVYLDRFKRRGFLSEWESAILQ